MRIIRNLILGAVAALGLALPAVAAERAIIVLDASGSMWAQINGEARITIARETLDAVLATLPDDLELGLMAYGHREKGNCGDIEMLVEPAAGTADAIKAAVADIVPKGMTPLSDAVRLAAEDLSYTEEKATVILITDGLETCDVDPCQLGSDLESKGVDFTTHVLGFGLSDEEGEQVACLAENTGGKYLSAQDGASLVEALTTTVAQVAQPVAEPEPEPAPEPEPQPAIVENNIAPTVSLSEGGPDLTNGSEGDVVWVWYAVNPDGTRGDYLRTEYYAEFKGNIEPGDYIMTAKLGEAEVEQPVTITADATAKPHFVLNAMRVKLHPRASADEPIADGAAVHLTWPVDGDTTYYGVTNTTVPAGELTVEVRLGEASVSETLTGKAGETIDKDIVVGSGIANITSEYVEGTAVQADISVRIEKAAKSIEGIRESITTGYGGEQQVVLPPGDYVAVYDLGGAEGEVPFTVETGKAIDVVLVLDAGIVVFTTPTDERIQILSVTKSIEGNQTTYDQGFGPEFQTTLKAGDYIIRHETTTGGEVDTPLTVKAGERAEVTLTDGKSK